MESKERCEEVVDTLFLGDGTANIGVEIRIRAVEAKDEE